MTTHFGKLDHGGVDLGGRPLGGTQDPGGSSRIIDLDKASGPDAAMGERLDFTLVQQLRAVVSVSLREERRSCAEANQTLSAADERELGRSLIASAVADYRRSQLRYAVPLPAPHTDTELAAAVEAALFGLGRLEPLLADETCHHIEVNGCDRVWLYRADGRVEQGPAVAESDAELIDWVRTAATYAGLSSRPFDPVNPWLELRLPNGARLCALMSVVDRPVVSIRLLRTQRVLLEELHVKGAFDAHLLAFLLAAVRGRTNLIVSGQTFSGKTTMLRALGNSGFGFTERIITAEHFLELGFDQLPDLHRDVVAMEERLPNAEGAGALTLLDLVQHSRRLNPDRLVVGEVIGGEIVAMLDAMSQGEDGSLSTIHARDSRAVFDRIATYALTSEHRLPVEATGMLIAGALDFVVHLSKTELLDGRVFRYVSSVREVLGFDGGQVVSSEVFATPPGELRAQPAAALSNRRAVQLAQAGYDPRRWRS